MSDTNAVQNADSTPIATSTTKGATPAASQGTDGPDHSGPDSPQGAVNLTVEILKSATHESQRLRIDGQQSLLHVLDEGAKALNENLLPTAEAPFDHLRGIYQHDQAGPQLDLNLTLDEFLDEKPVTHRFGIELVLAIRVNTRWREAPAQSMTPKDILSLFGLSSQEYSLYLPDGKEPLAVDTPIDLHRGEAFEAQKDGKYGGGR
jgi:hypothetical protein